MNRTISQKFANFSKNLKFNMLPKEVMIQAKKCLLDFIGVAIAGSECPLLPVLLRITSHIDTKQKAIVIGQKKSASLLFAPLINGTLGHFLELDDGHRASISHPGTVVIPAALAVAENRNSSGKDLLLSVILGYEIICRIGRSIQPSHQTIRGFHTTGTCGTFGAAIAASKLFELSNIKTTNALGLAGLQASGLLEVMNNGSMSKPFQAGKASHNGLLAALLAKYNIKSPITIFEGKKGFLNAMANKWNKRDIFEDFGKKFLISEIYFKFHAACGLVHSSIDAIIKIMEENNLNTKDIKRIILKVQTYAADVVGKKNIIPKTPEEAKFSLPFNAAIAALYRKANREQYTMKIIRNPEVISLIKKSEVIADKNLDKTFPIKRSSIAVIETISGIKFEKKVDCPKGSPENPPSYYDIFKKFLYLTNSYINNTHANRIAEMVEKIDKMENIIPFIKLL